MEVYVLGALLHHPHPAPGGSIMTPMSRKGNRGSTAQGVNKESTAAVGRCEAQMRRVCATFRWTQEAQGQVYAGNNEQGQMDEHSWSLSARLSRSALGRMSARSASGDRASPERKQELWGPHSSLMFPCLHSVLCSADICGSWGVMSGAGVQQGDECMLAIAGSMLLLRKWEQAPVGLGQTTHRVVMHSCAHRASSPAGEMDAWPRCPLLFLLCTLTQAVGVSSSTLYGSGVWPLGHPHHPSSASPWPQSLPWTGRTLEASLPPPQLPYPLNT